jgi:hypothetical protein
MGEHQKIDFTLIGDGLLKSCSKNKKKVINCPITKKTIKRTKTKIVCAM